MTAAFLLVTAPLLALPEGIIDFSTAGYGGGGVGLPVVPARAEVRPSGGADDAPAIQAALDAVGRLQPDAQGFRGAVILRPGTFHIGGQLRITASGVVLRGHDAVLVASGQSRRTLIEIRGRADRALGPGVPVAGDFVPAGARVLTVASTAGFAPGARVLVRRPSTQEWISALAMDQFKGPAGPPHTFDSLRLPWRPGTRDLEWERTVVAVDAAARKLTLDAPITTALEARFGGATVHSLTWPGRIAQVGVENLTCVSEFDANNPVDEEHAWICVSLDQVENAWVRHVTARRFTSTAVWVGAGARAVTVEDCASEQPVSELGGWRRVSFYVGGQQVLVQRCTADDGRHDFVAGHCAAGPNVFLDCRATRSHGDSGAFESWASGTLYEGVRLEGAGLVLGNLHEAMQGAGWAAANSVAWNCTASGGVRAENPPGAVNFAVTDSANASLFRAQLAARRGAASWSALAAAVPAPDHDTVPTIPVPAPAARPPAQLLAISNGRFTVGGRTLFGDAIYSRLWLGQLPPTPDNNYNRSPIRWAPGRTGPGWTEDLDELTDTMRAQGAPFFMAAPGLWYDRRRDEHSTWPREDGDVWGPFLEMPWARSGRGRAWDGLSKYDLTKLNPWYWSRLREFADDCAAKGVVLVHHFYHNHNVQEAAAHWTDYPWCAVNCLQETGLPNPPPDGKMVYLDEFTLQFYDLTSPAHREWHRQFIWQGLDALAGEPNVIHTVSSEFAGPLEFQQFFLDTVAQWQQARGQRVHVALITSKAVTDAILADPARAGLVDVVSQRYWQYLADGRLFAPDGQGTHSFRDLRTRFFGTYDGPVPPGTPELVYRQVREYRDRFPGKAIVCGDAGQGPIPIVMAGGAAPLLNRDARDPHASRDDAAFLKFVNERLADALPRMNPRDDVVRGGAWCLADDGLDCVLIDSRAGGGILLAHPLAGRAAWFNPRTGQTSEADLSASGTLAKPSAEEWLLLVREKKR